MLSEQGLVDETRQAQEDYDTVLEEMRFIEKVGTSLGFYCSQLCFGFSLYPPPLGY